MIELNTHIHMFRSGRGIISPDGQEFICQNLTDGIQRYSLIKRTSAVPTGAKHDHLLSLVGRPKNLFYGLDFLDRRTLLTGHNNGCVIVIRDTGRMDSSQRYDTQYIELHKKSKGKRRSYLLHCYDQTDHHCSNSLCGSRLCPE